ncbi:MAG: succinylglutamate desuccinylase/aspartoacylase family protein [Gammaproteobacteria bacterium]|nr:succinylglutamate desuccinylase/aspartoacylase family protein [Gammaproteobacteria bacterium]
MIGRVAVFALAVVLLGACGRKPAAIPAGESAQKPPAGQTQEQEQRAITAPVGMRGGNTMELLGETIPPGTMRRLLWSGGQSFDGSSDQTPVLVINGMGRGPTLCLTGAIHGDELNGIEIVRRVTQDLEPARIRGAVIGVPIVNLQGFRRGSRYLPDRRDLNRHFPGNPGGSAASRIAWSLFDSIIRHCDGLIDVHTGSLNRTNLPQLRADLRDEKIRNFVDGFGGMLVLHNPGRPGTLRYAAARAGIPAVTLEAGEPGRLQSAQVREGTAGIVRLLDALKIVNRVNLLSEARPIYYQSKWIRADHGGILFSLVRLGQMVKAGDVLGTVTDPISNEQNLIYTPVDGRVIGMALNQMVMPGFATFNLGIAASSAPDESLATAQETPIDDRPEE